MTRHLAWRRGASMAAYSLVVGLVGLVAAVAATRTGEQVSGLTTKVAGSVNAVDGALAGNNGPVFGGRVPQPQVIELFDSLAEMDFTGFLDPEGDTLSYEMRLTGGLTSDDLVVSREPGGYRVTTGTPSASGTIAVVASDPIGRSVSAGPVQITVSPNEPPILPDAPGPVEITEGARLSLVYEGVADPDGDTINAVSQGVPFVQAVYEDTKITVTSDPLPPGEYELQVGAIDAHGARGDAPSISVVVHPLSCESLNRVQPGLESKVYTIDPDGPDGQAPFAAYCDMETDGGGWTLAMRLSNSDNNFTYASGYWTTPSLLNETALGPFTGPNDSGEAKYAAFNSVPGSEMRIEFLRPDYDMLYGAVGDMTLLGLFSGGPGASNVRRTSGCNGHALTSVPGYTSALMRHGEGRQVGGLNAVYNSSRRVRYGFMSNDESYNAPFFRQGIGYQTSSVGWGYQSDCNNCGGCYGSAYSAGTTAANLWVR